MQIKNYCVRKTSPDTARVAFKIQPPVRLRSSKSEIIVRSTDSSRTGCRPEGILLDPGPGPEVVAVVHVRRGEAVFIRWRSVAGRIEGTSCFTISQSFEPVHIESGTPDLNQPEPTLEYPIKAVDGTLIRLSDQDLRKLFTSRHPAWLQSRIEAALKTWWEDDPALYFRVAPPARIQGDIPLLVRWSPERALEEFQLFLDAGQLNSCITNRPDAAVRHAFDRVSRADRVALVRSQSTFVLNHYLDRLTELELEVAASADPMTAFELRHFAVDRRHAILTAKSYPASFFSDTRPQDRGLADEVKRSVLDHPRTWHRIHHHSFTILFRSLRSTMGIVFSGSELLELQNRLGLRLGKALGRYISSLI